MNVGELFVNIGLAGSDKFLGGLNAANKSLSTIKDTGLETFERLTLPVFVAVSPKKA